VLIEKRIRAPKNFKLEFKNIDPKENLLQVSEIFKKIDFEANFCKNCTIKRRRDLILEWFF